MNKKKMWKRFFSLDRHHAEGFTLVELIVVIAILAILGGVAVPAYSGYVERANKGADQTLIGEVQHALVLYHYANPDVTNMAVILSQEGTAPEIKGNADAQAALEAVFGASWQDLHLKHADWRGESSTLSYKESSYYGKESDLVNTVDKLTSALGDVVAKDKQMGNILIGKEFGDFLDGQDVDRDNGKAVGNAAVLYVAQKTQGKETEITNAFNTGLAATASSPAQVVNNLYATLSQTGIGDAAAMAAIYAYAEGFAQETGKADIFHTSTDFSDVTNTQSALEALGKGFECLAQNQADFEAFATYNSDQGKKDLQGYMDMMGTVNSNQSIVSGNLNSDDCFTDGTVENMLKGHAAMGDLGVTTGDGQVAVIVYRDADGVIRSHVNPMSWNQ